MGSVGKWIGGGIPGLLAGSGIFGSNIPTPPPPPLAAHAPVLANPQAGLAGAIQSQMARKAAGAGFSGTVKNVGGPAGLVVKASQKAATSLLS